VIPTEEQTPDGSTAFSRAAAADVVVEIGYPLDGLELDDVDVDSSNYSISEDGCSITIKKEYLAGLSNGTKEFTIPFDDDDTYVLWDVVISGDHAATFARGEAADVAVSVADAEITGLEFLDDDVDASNYTISNSDHTITIKKEYLATLANGVKTFKILEGDTAFDTVAVTISGNGSAAFSKADPADIEITLADVEITGLKIGSVAVNTDNYAISDDKHTITIDDEYLGGLANGDKNFHVLYGTDGDFTYVVTVGD